MPPDADPEDDSLRELVEEPVQPIPFLTDRHGPYGDIDDYEAFRERLAAGGAKPREDAWPDAQLLGHATNEQYGDPVIAGPWVYEDTEDDD